LEPVSNICKQCLLEGKLMMVCVCEDREAHMEKFHGLTGAPLKEMILNPKLHFLSLTQVIECLQDYIEKEQSQKV
jgi:hypothetical protein